MNSPLNSVRVALTPLCSYCEAAMEQRGRDWFCPAWRWWRFWQHHDRSHDGWFTMRRVA